MSGLLANCIPSAIPFPTLFGAQILSIAANPITNFSRNITVDAYPNHPAINAANLTFCNITVTHTHPGQGDRLNTEIWLPVNPKWNERMQMVGGGGFAAGRAEPDSYVAMAGAVAEGYVGVTIDAGLPTFEPKDWALLSPGNVDLYKLQNLASVSLNDGAVIAKAVLAAFYGAPAKYSYYSGCSQGGRQGLMLAQRYPTAFDGIAAAAPGVNWPQFFVSHLYPQQLMAELGHYPAGCEFDALSAAAKKACDGLDGVADGLLADPDACRFDPFSLVGREIANCTSFPGGGGRKWKVSKAAAEVANAMWRMDARNADGSFMWYLTGYEARMTGFGGLADTVCQADGTCAGNPLSVFTEWTRLYVKKDPAYDPTAPISRKAFEKIFRASVEEYESVMGTNNPDLSEFNEAGGKMITFHGLVSFSWTNARLVDEIFTHTFENRPTF